MEMLGGLPELTLDFLNEATQAWVEIEYNRAVHREIGCSPVDAIRPSAGRAAAEPFRRMRCGRRFAWKRSGVSARSDGTISLDGVRFEIPARYRHFQDVVVRYARWDLSRVDLVDPRERNHSGSASIRWTAPPMPTVGARSSIREHDETPADRQRSRSRTTELPPLLKQDPRRVLRHGTAAGLPAEETSIPRKEKNHECQETALAVGTEMEPVFARTSQRRLAGDRQDREFRLARRTTCPGRRLRPDLRRVGNRQVGGVADRRRTALGACATSWSVCSRGLSRKAPTSIASWAISSR